MAICQTYKVIHIYLGVHVYIARPSIRPDARVTSHRHHNNIPPWSHTVGIHPRNACVYVHALLMVVETVQCTYVY